MARRSGSNIAAGSKNLITSDTFAGLVAGDRVRLHIKDDPILGKFDRMLYEFVAHCTNIENGKQWVTLWGGPPRHQGWLSVESRRIRKVDRRR